MPAADGTWMSATTFGGIVTVMSIFFVDVAAAEDGSVSHFQRTEIVPRIEWYVAPNEVGTARRS